MSDQRQKTRLAVVCGGRSAEHEVSLASTKNIIAALNQEKYEIVLLMLDRQGRLLASDASEASRLAGVATGTQLAAGSHVVEESEWEQAPSDAVTIARDESGTSLIRLRDRRNQMSIDVLFPVMHGPDGEDGSIQGLARLAGIPVVGSGVLGSAVNMDKDVMKRLLREAGLPIPQFVSVKNSDRARLTFEGIAEQLGLPFFVKPANLGSSVGVSRVDSEEDFDSAIDGAFCYDTKILCEEFINGRELECAVLGTSEPIASVPGEIVTARTHGFYSYEAKYLDEHGASLRIPAAVHQELAARIRELACRAFAATCCEGMARVDFFLRGEDEIVINELNTIPGFTDVSMFPRLWEASGMTVSEVLDRLIEDAVQRFEARSRLKTRVGE